MLAGPAMHSCLYGGRRAGKSAIYCYALIVRSMKAKSKHVIFRQHFKDVKTAIGMETMPFVMKAFKDQGLKVNLNKTDWFWEFPHNDSQIWLGGLDEKERTEKLLGMEWSTEFFNEGSQMSYDSVEIALSGLAERSGLAPKAYYDCNPPSKRHWIYTLFIQHIHPISNMPVDPDNYVSLRMNPDDNRENIAEGYIENNLNTLSERKRKRFRDGEFLDDVEGALWNHNMISAYRVLPDAVPDLHRIVVGVDPAVTSNPDSDDTGIVVAGVDGRPVPHYYVLADRTLKGTPRQWAEAVIAAYLEFNADRVVGETNNGGDLVETNLRTVDASVSYKSVHASRGKMIRAEPVAALYEAGRVHHVGELPDLEEEMCGFTGDPKQASPNRLDGLVWSITELCGGHINPHVGVPQDRPDTYVEKRVDEELERLYSEASPAERLAMRQAEQEAGL